MAPTTNIDVYLVVNRLDTAGSVRLGEALVCISSANPKVVEVGTKGKGTYGDGVRRKGVPPVDIGERVKGRALVVVRRALKRPEKDNDQSCESASEAEPYPVKPLTLDVAFGSLLLACLTVCTYCPPLACTSLSSGSVWNLYDTSGLVTALRLPSGVVIVTWLSEMTSAGGTASDAQSQ